MNISKAKCTGKSHREFAVPNEDFVLAKHITTDVSMAVLADGAGSKKYGGLTAEYLVGCVEQYCRENAKRPDFLNGVKFELFRFVNEKIISMIQETNSVMDDYGSTMVFVIVCDDKYVAGHVGDGAILYKTQSEFEVLSLPENGEYINQTYFLPTIEKESHFRMYEGRLEKEFCFVLTSDGLSGTLYNPVNNQVSHVCEQIYQWCQKYSEEECDKILEDNLVEVFDKYSDDDKSIAVVCNSMS